MKKFFSLVLALVMALSLTTVAWGASNEAKIGSQEYATLQAAVNAATPGDVLIEMLTDVSADVTIGQQEGINITIDGGNNEFSGTFKVVGNNRYDGAETLTFQNIAFTTTEANHYFIDSNDQTAPGRYAHNVTVQDCTFTATGAGEQASVAMRFRQAFNINMIDCDVTGLHSSLQAYGCSSIAVEDLTATDCKNGISVGTSKEVSVKEFTFESDVEGSYGVRADGYGGGTVTVEDSTIEAFVPVLVRDTTSAGFTLSMSGDNELDASNPDGLAVAFSKDDYDSSTATLEAPDVSFSYNNNDDSLVTYPVFVAKIGDAMYTTVTAATTAAGANDTVVLLDASATIPDGYQVLANGTVVPVTAANVPTPTLYVWDNAAEDWATYYIATGAEMDDLKQDASDKCLPCYLIDGEYFVEVPESAATYKLVYGYAKVFLTSVPAKVVKYVDTASVLTVVDAEVAECGDYYVTNLDEDDVYYVSYDKKGVVDGIWVKAKNGSVQILVNGKIVDAEVAPVTFMFHDFKGYDVVNYQYTTVKCAECGKVAKLYANATAATVGKLDPFKIGNLGWVTFADYMDFGAVSAPSTDKVVESAQTFDAGIAMYVGMSVIAAAGSAVVLKKKD